MKELMEFFKNSFGKEKNTRSHAIAMLAIYGIFMVIIVVAMRTTPVKEESNEPVQNNTSHQEVIDDSIEKNDDKSNIKKNYDVNYSYSYTITLDAEKEVYLGKKVDDKEKFSFIKDNSTIDYAILDGNYLVLENGIYHITDTLDTYFRYCNVDRIISVLEKSEYVEANNKYIYNLSNTAVFNMLLDNIKNDNKGLNTIELEFDTENLKAINMNLDNYISSVLDGNHTLSIKMEFANVGTTEDFEIKVS